ncbi:sugar phosphate isomerase/epimerase family protein [Aquipuribacter sp. MA13-6]|uniref:sugar phosphate isomerase/epimerase family protein n=1 Tax=unclassified Aquipuribacter TaxID=2635084 RepID=UPI003EE83197
MTPDRRAFLRAATVAAISGLGAAGAVASPAAATTRGRHGVPRGAISIQLYSLRSIMTNPTTAEVALETLAEMGFVNVETAGTYGMSPAVYRAMLDRVGLRATSAHIGGVGNPEAVAQEAATLGARFVNFPYAAYTTLEPWRVLADGLNRVGEACQAYGIRYGYHNHALEFEVEENGVQAYDVLLTETDDRLVHMQLDLYWAVTGGQDPVEVFRRDPRRFMQFHVKDRDEVGFFADPGEGTIDFPSIFSEQRLSGVIEYIVENDQPADPLEFARTGIDYLRDVRF